MGGMGELQVVLPKWVYFTSGNVYSGSTGDFNFKIWPGNESKGEELRAVSWRGKGCLGGTLSAKEPKSEAAFPMNEKGFADMTAWLTNLLNGNVEN